MLKEVILGKIGLTMDTGTVVSWLKDEGDFVEKGEPLFEVETDKATQTIESYHSGYLRKILVPAGREVQVRTVIAYIGEREDKVPVGSSVGFSPEAETPPASTGASPKERGSAGGERRAGINASPLAKRLAAELGVDLSQVKGTGSDGRIGKEDVLAAKERLNGGGGQSGVEQEVAADISGAGIPVASQEKLEGIKKVVAERMKKSYTEAPHIHLELWVDMSGPSNLRKKLNSDPGFGAHLTFSDMFIFAAARTLRNHMHLNATLRNGSIVVFDEINIGLAVATEKGLVVPVVAGADRLDLGRISRAREELVQRTQAGHQTHEDLANGTFTITNLGMLGVISFKPIINTGQTATLAVGKVQPTPIADDAGSVQVRPVANFSLACDHRIVDGAAGATFLSDFKDLLENPSALIGR